MIQVLLISNPFQPFQDLVRTSGEEGQTINEWLRGHFGPDFREFDRPTVCQYNGEMITRDRWNQPMKPGDVVAFVTLPGDVVSLVIAIVAVIIAVAAVLLIADPKIPQDNTPAANSVYTLRGQQNRFRPNEPIEVSYGRVRHWPTFIARPYSEYIGNDQYQYSLFCVGQGYFDIHETQLDDTPTSDFIEVEVEIVPPGGSVTLVESAVVTSLEVANIELLGPNHDDYEGISGPFTLNPWEQPIHRIAVDVSFPQGLYSVDKKKGSVRSLTVQLLFEYREIDQDGGSIGTWQTIANPTVTRSTTTPQRLTFSKNVPSGRYEVRGQRISDSPGGIREVSQSRWETVKGYAKDVGNFGNVTVIAMKAKATNSLNDNSNKAFNVIATRKLPTWTPGGGWGSRVATRNPVWAMCDVFRASYGAKLPDEYLDMPTLYALAQVVETNNLWFDWTFDDPITVWEAATTIMRVMRSVPVPQGSLITAVRDIPQTLPAAVFNQHNIITGSLTKNLSLFEFQPFDGLVVEYTDPDTWKTKEVRCVLPGRDGLNLDRVKLAGCTSRQRAYREGLYIQTRKEFQRKSVTFKTGLEGHIPSYMDLVAITHDTVRVGQGGMVLAYNTSTKEMTLSEQVTFTTPNLVHKIVLRGDDGAPVGNPIDCTPGSAPNKVILAHNPSPLPDFSENRVPPLYSFGVGTLWSFLGKVARISPVDSHTVELTVVNYVPECYTRDADEPDTVTEVRVIRNRNNPLVEWVTLSPVADVDDRLFVDWLPVPGAVSYVVQLAYREVNNPSNPLLWNTVGTFQSAPVQVTVDLGTVRARVAPFSLNGNVRYTESNDFVVGSNIEVPPAPVPAATQLPFEELVATARWQAVSGAYGYDVEVRATDGVTVLRNVSVGSGLETSYDNDMLLEDSPSTRYRTLHFYVTAYNSGGDSDPCVIILTNPLPVNDVTAFNVGTPSGSNYPCTWTHTQEDDHRDYLVFTSTVDGFTPAPGNLLATVTDPSHTIPAPTRPLYVCIGIRDVWGDDYLTSAQYVIP